MPYRLCQHVPSASTKQFFQASRVLFFMPDRDLGDRGVFLFASVHDVVLHCQQVSCQPWPSTAKAAT